MIVPSPRELPQPPAFVTFLSVTTFIGDRIVTNARVVELVETTVVDEGTPTPVAEPPPPRLVELVDTPR